MFCTKCGNPLMNEAIICPRCGCGTVNYQVAMPYGVSQVGQQGLVYANVKVFAEECHSLWCFAVFNLLFLAGIFLVLSYGLLEEAWGVIAVAIVLAFVDFILSMVVSGRYDRMKNKYRFRVASPSEACEWEKGNKKLQAVGWMDRVVFIVTLIPTAVATIGILAFTLVSMFADRPTFW